MTKKKTASLIGVILAALLLGVLSQIKSDEPATTPSPKTVESDAPAIPSPEAVGLEKTGNDTWISPAGLVYQGRDPQGRTRVDHVRRHMRDIPDREGRHGVFDGGEEVAWAVIDEAWLNAQQRRMKADPEGSRSTYVVPMGRRIGYLGGRVGAAKRNPPLKRVSIVFKTGTKNIITAYPK